MFLDSYIRHIVTNSCKTCCLMCLIPLIGVLIAGSTFKMDDNNTLSWFMEGHDSTNSYLTSFAAQQRILEFEDQPIRSQNAMDMALSVGFGTNDGTSIFTPERLARIKELETIVRTFPGMENFCLASPEDSNICSTDANEPFAVSVVDEFYSGTSLNDIDTVLNGFATNYYEGKATFVGDDFIVDDTSKRWSTRTRSVFRFGLPLEGYKNSMSDVVDQQKEVQDFQADILETLENTEEFICTECDIQLFLYSQRLEDEAALTYAATDFKFVMGAIIFVFIYMSIHTKSLYLAFAGMGQIIMSFPLSYGVYHFILAVDLFLSLQILSMFIIIGIGADNVFVFVDAWCQSAKLCAKTDLISRMTYTFKRATKAMFVTSFTTFAAFMATGMSDIKPIACFGQFAAVLVIWNYFFVCTLFPCCVVFWHRRFRYKNLLQCLMLKWGCIVNLDGTMIDSQIAPESGSETQEQDNTNTTSPTTTTTNNGPESNPTSKAKSQQYEQCVVVEMKASSTVNTNNNDININSLGTTTTTSSSHPKDLRTIEKFFDQTWTEFCFKYKWIIIGVFLVIGAIGGYFTSQLSPITEAEVWLPDHLDIIVSKSFFDDNFGSSQDDPTVPAEFLFGIQELDRSGTNRWNPEDYGTIVWNPNFNLSIPANQQWLLDFCTELKASSFIEHKNTICFMEAYRDWRIKNSLTFPAHFVGSVEEIKKAFSEDLLKFDKDEPFFKAASYINFDDVGNLYYVVVSGQTALEFSNSYDEKKPTYDQIEAFKEKKIKSAPVGLETIYFHGNGGWAWMFSSHAFVSNLVQGVIISMIVATIVMCLSTQNWIVSLLTIVNIIGILLCVMGSMEIRNWELGVTESIAGVVVVGFSFDYAVHLANSFIESHHSTRKEKMRSALREMGISVFAGAITSAGAGSVMFLCVMMFFTKFAFMMVMNVVSALVWSCAFLPAILMAIGPTANSGNIPFAKILGFFKKK